MYQKILKIFPVVEFKKFLTIHKFFIPLLFFVNFVAYFIKPLSEIFDSALFKLQLLYPAIGLKVYEDFVSIYPLGPSLISIFVTKITHGFVNPLNLVWLFHLFLQLLLVKKFIQANLVSLTKIPFLYLFLIFETLIYAKLGGEPFSLLLTFITLIEFYEVYKNNQISLQSLIYPTMLIFFKWDRLLFCGFVFSIFFIVCKIKKLNVMYLHLIKITIISIASFIFLFLSLYIFNPSNFFNTLRYIFIDPFIIAKYRSLSFDFSKPIFTAYNIYYVLLFLYLGIFWFLMNTKANSEKVFFYCMGLSLIPPTFSRSDLGHFIPFYFSSFFLLYSLPYFIDEYLTKYFDKLVLLIKSLSIILVTCFLAVEMKAPLLVNTCANLKFDEKPKSIFVGNAQYDSFFINFPLLYLNYLYLKPASKYISDEPGLQNECSIQDEIITDFSKAPKPTIFFINKTLLIDKNNKNTYSNCKKIEEYIASSTKIIGRCNVSENNLDIRISK